MPKKVNPFRFKQFIVHHDRCAMKVGTDAVLLGAWIDVEHAQTILDIGSGSGVIALMLAQRTSPSARIDAVEIDQDSFHQSNENIARSPWPKKIATHNTSIQEFIPERKYDLIVSNPPYFINSLLPPSESRRDARHTSSLTHSDLLVAAKRLLKPQGKFGVILPTSEGEQFQTEVAREGLYCSRRVAFRSRPEKPSERWLLEFGHARQPMIGEALVLYSEGEQWTDRYEELVAEFYL